MEEINAYATLLTRPTYLAGAILLAHSLHRHSPSTPLLILYTPDTLPDHCIAALNADSKHTNAIPRAVPHLRLPADPDSKHAHGGMAAERFVDTWTKLRVFEQHEANDMKISRLCFLDADMLVRSNPSPLVFNPDVDTYLTGDDASRICATHVCVCNLDHDSWAPSTWMPVNCAFTPLDGPDASPPKVEGTPPDTKALFNSGTFVFRPSPALSSLVLGTFASTSPAELRAMKFPDQDFLNKVFAGRWASLSWRVNALKTWRYWHPRMWRDDSVAVLHYIVDKPWAARIADVDGELRAGYKGMDGETHKWWWEAYAQWRADREVQGEEAVVKAVEEYVVGEDGAESEEMRAIGARAQDFAKKWEGKKGEQADEKGGEDEKGRTYGQGSHGPVLRKPMLGERGHGPVVRRGGRGRGLRGRAEGVSYMEP